MAGQPEIIGELAGVLSFQYDGIERRVVDAVLRKTSEGHIQIAGRQILRGEDPRNEIRVFRLDRVSAAGNGSDREEQGEVTQ